jgi:aspartate aminotransferase
VISQRAKNVKPSATLAIDAKAKAMKAEGVDVINFSVGEPDFDTPENIKEAAAQAMRDGFTKYTAAGGIDPLKEAIVNKFRQDNGLEYEKSEVIVSCGAKHSLYNIAQAMNNPGDEIIIPAPFWVSYPDQAILSEAKPVIVKTQESNSFMVTPEALEAAVTPNTKALILNSPSNPTGLAYDKKTLEAIAELAIKHDFYVVSDEIYEKILYDGTEHISIASFSKEIKDRTIVVNGVSKSHCMTGWRIGYAAGPQEIIKAMGKIQSQSTSNPTSISQKAAIEALNGPQDFLAPMVAAFDERRKYMVEALNSLSGVSCSTPTGAFYCFPNVKALYNDKVKNSTELALYLLQEANVALVPGDAFGDDDYIRISYAIGLDDLKRAMVRIKAALDKMQA